VQPVLSTVDGVASADILAAKPCDALWLDPVKMAGAAYRRTMSRRRSRPTTPGRRGQAKGYFIVSNVRPYDLPQPRSIQAA